VGSVEVYLPWGLQVREEACKGEQQMDMMGNVFESGALSKWGKWEVPN
jgi:hypothetical protein